MTLKTWIFSQKNMKELQLQTKFFEQSKETEQN